MTHSIPSTSIRTKYLKTVPLGTIYKDPRNNHNYEVVEKKVGTSFAKVAVPYFGDREAVDVQVPSHLMKVENPVRANVMTLMKDRITHLEAENSQLKLQVYPFGQIKVLMKGKTAVEFDNYTYQISDGIVFHLPKKGDISMSEFIDSVWTDPELLGKVMKRQQKTQTKLLDLLLKHGGP